MPIELDQTRHLLFSLNVLDEMQDKFGGFDKLDAALEGKDSMKNLRWLLTQLLNEGADDGEPELEEKRVGKLIHAGNLVDVKDAIFAAFAMGTVGDDPPPENDDDPGDDDGDDEKNAKGKQGK